MSHVGHPCGSSRHRSHLTPRLHPRPSLLTILSFCHSVKKSSPALAFKKPSAILIPLEVYMVNSPSRPNSRPVAPPDLVECGGMTPLWHRETCLPIERPARSAPLLCDLTASVRVRGGDGPVPTLVAVEFGQSRQKPQQSRQIKPHQGKRQFSGVRPFSGAASAKSASRATMPNPIQPTTLPKTRNPGADALLSSRLQSRQKPQQSRQIKPHQGKRQFSGVRPFSGAASAKSASRATMPNPIQPTTLPKTRNPGADALLSSRLQSRQKPQQSRQIKPHQGKREIFQDHPYPANCHRYPAPEFPLCAFATPRLCVTRHQGTIKPQSRQKPL